MPSVQLSDLRTLVFQRADMENSLLVSPDECDDYISKGYQKLYDILTTSFMDYYIASPHPLTITSGDNSGALPDDFYKLRGVDKQCGSEWDSLKPFNFRDRNKWRYNHGEYKRLPRYQLRGSSIYFAPDELAEGTYQLWYVPVATLPSNDSDTIDGINGWEDYVINFAARKCALKEESFALADRLKAENLEIKSEIESSAARRDIGETQAVLDVREHEWYRDLY